MDTATAAYIIIGSIITILMIVLIITKEKTKT